MMYNIRPLTSKESAIIDALNAESPGAGDIAKLNLLNQSSDWAKQIAELSVEDAIEATKFVVNTLKNGCCSPTRTRTARD